ncbi:DUF4435 domain-containing protein [Sphingobium sp.]|uniref:DUF4435 domain-containing protein n=1 Tax=Sphingobium sp. TaxID=1912891 RepID=UPI001A1BE254|nr:DUF4435 domain-containing protein [Sphingobium sp.]MBJ7377058.1 DUF4435 domain-containing protein [Sphingobium sp.]
MTFTRSSSALYGIHKFFGVDVVVYCEGGKSLTYQEAIRTENTDGTLDTFYWSSLVNEYGIDKKFHFKSVGGKETIRAISIDIEKLNLTNVTVCRDSDYDRVLGKELNCSRLAWTYGYSWENDVLNIVVIENLVVNLVGSSGDGEAVIHQLREKFSKFQSDLRPWVEVDISLCSRGKKALFDREKPLSVIDMKAPPSLREGSLAQNLVAAGYRRKPRKVAAVSEEEVGSVCFGKLISRSMYHTFTSVLSGVLRSRIDYELFMRMAINETFRSIRAGVLPELTAHLQLQRAAFE